MEINKLIEIGHFVLIIIAVIALGLLAINQGLGYIYKSQFLQSPCNLCEKVNPEVTVCPKFNCLGSIKAGQPATENEQILYIGNFTP